MSSATRPSPDRAARTPRFRSGHGRFLELIRVPGAVTRIWPRNALIMVTLPGSLINKGHDGTAAAIICQHATPGR
jgi:hypothetical protein